MAQMSEIDWDKILYGGLTASLIKFFWDGVKFVREIKKTKKRKSKADKADLLNALLKNNSKITDTLTKYCNDASIPRIVIGRFNTLTGDRIMTNYNLKNDAQVTILYEIIHHSYFNKIKPIKFEFQEYTMPYEHKKLAVELITKGECEYNPNRSNVKIVRQLAAANNIDMKIFHKIASIKGEGVFFIDISVTNNESLSDVNNVYKTTILIQKLKELFNEIYVIKKQILELG